MDAFTEEGVEIDVEGVGFISDPLSLYKLLPTAEYQVVYIEGENYGPWYIMFLEGKRFTKTYVQYNVDSYKVRIIIVHRVRDLNADPMAKEHYLANDQKLFDSEHFQKIKKTIQDDPSLLSDIYNGNEALKYVRNAFK